MPLDMCHCRLLNCIIAIVLCASAQAVVGAKEKPSNVATFLKQYCHECHGPETQDAGLRLDQLDAFRATDLHLWTNVFEKLSSGEMPPKDELQPSSAEKKKVLAWIETEQTQVATSSLRRLNRRELGAALRDVTGLSVDFAQTLPGDG